jgi:hypothetical protein
MKAFSVTLVCDDGRMAFIVLAADVEHATDLAVTLERGAMLAPPFDRRHFHTICVEESQP